MFTLIFCLGLLLGSTIYAFALRYHDHKNWLSGRSECDYCHHSLNVTDLIPLVSWLLLRGKCRYCRRSLSWEYPVTELATAVLFCLSYVFWPLLLTGLGLFEFICWLLLMSGFMVLIIYDFKWYKLPNKIVFPLIGLSFFQLVVVSLIQHDLEHFVGGIIGAILIAGIFYFLFQLSSGTWIGGGDVKLAICLGLIVGGPINSVLLIFIASVLGTIAAIPAFIKKRDINIQIPFGPFLMIATIIVFIFGSHLVTWYSHLIT